MIFPYLKKVAKRHMNRWAEDESREITTPATAMPALSAKGWHCDPEVLARIAQELVIRGYGNVYKRQPALETANAYLPAARFLIDRSGLFVDTPTGQAAEIAEKFSYDDGKWTTAATMLLEIIMRHLPENLGVNGTAIEVHAWALAKYPKTLIKEIAAFAATEGGLATGVMQSWQDAVILRLYDQKGVESHRLPSLDAFPSWPDTSPDDLMDALFRSSPFKDLLNLWVPITIPDKATRTHAHGMGPTGCGKTTFNEAKIITELGDKGMVLFDTKGGMAKRIIRHGGRPQDILEIDFSDPNQRPMFNLAQPPIGSDPEHVADMMGFILAGLGVDFTALQKGTFEMLTKVVVGIPTATLETFIQVIESKEFARRHVADSSEDVKAWFATQYNTPPIQAARTQIARKLWNIIGSPAMNSLFNGDCNTLDFKGLLDAKKLVIITISKQKFKNYTNIISRACIAAIDAAMWRRQLPIEGPDWVLFFDELRDVIGSYDDSLIEELADQGREYHVCLHFTHQRLEQMSKDVKSAIINNASVNFYANIDPVDASYLAKRMGCSPSDILNIEADDYLYFCLAIKGYAKAGRCRIKAGYIQSLPALSDADMQRQREAHRAYWQRVNGRFVRVDRDDSGAPKLKLITSDGDTTVDDVLPWERS